MKKRFESLIRFKFLIRLFYVENIAVLLFLLSFLPCMGQDNKNNGEQDI